MTIENKNKFLFWNEIIKSVITYAIFGWVVWVSQAVIAVKTDVRDLNKLVGQHLAESKKVVSHEIVKSSLFKQISRL